MLPHYLTPALETKPNNTVFTENMADIDYSRRNRVPRLITDNEKAKLEEFIDSIHYSARSAVPDLSVPAVILTPGADIQIMSSSTDTFSFRRLC